MQEKKRSKWQIVIPVIVVSILLTSLYFFFNIDKSKEVSMPLREYEVFRGDIVAGINAEGHLFLTPVSHYFPVPVQLEEIYVRKGDTVKAGDKIAKAIDSGLEDPYIYAKLNGVVLSVPLVEGEMTDGRPIVAQIGDPRKIGAQIEITQSYIGDVEMEQSVNYTLNAYPTAILKGKVKQIQLAPGSANPLKYIVYASIEAEEHLLLEGMTFSASLIQKQVKGVLCLSNKAIQLKKGRQVVYLMDGEGDLLEREIQTGFSDGRYSEIISGLSEGDIVYVEG